MNGEVLRLAVVLAGFVMGAVFVISMSVRFFIELYGEVDLKKLKAKAAKKEQRKRKRASAGVKGYGYNSSPRLGVIRRASRVDRHHHVVGDLDGSNGTVVR